MSTAGKRFLIWSMQEKAWWKPEATGYTKSKAEAGRYTIEEATSHNLDGAGKNTPEGADVLVVERY